MASSNRDRALSANSILRFGLLIILWGAVGGLFFPGLRAHAEKGYYAIQVGAYRDITGAEEMVFQLKKLGHDAFFRKEQIINKGRWFRVYVEKFQTKAEAEKEGKVLKQLGLISEYAVRRIEPPGPLLTQKKEKSVVFFLHVSSFREKINADGLVNSLNSRGQKAFHVTESMSGQIWFRVYIGEFGSEAEARLAGNGLQERGVIGYFKIIEIDKKTLVSGE